MMQQDIRAEIVKTGRMLLTVASLIGGGAWAARGVIDTYVDALGANTVAIHDAVQSISDLRTDLFSFKSDMAKEIGELRGAQQELERQRKGGLDTDPVPAKAG